MPFFSRLAVKTSLAYLIAALIMGLLLAAAGLGWLPAGVAAFNPVYFHLFMVGWVMQLIIGVAYWMFPKFTRAQPRGSTPLAWITYLGLNGGLLTRAVAEPALTLAGGGGWGWALAIAALLQWVGGVAFVANTWTRVKEK